MCSPNRRWAKVPGGSARESALVLLNQGTWTVIGMGLARATDWKKLVVARCGDVDSVVLRVVGQLAGPTIAGQRSHDHHGRGRCGTKGWTEIAPKRPSALLGSPAVKKSVSVEPARHRCRNSGPKARVRKKADVWLAPGLKRTRNCGKTRNRLSEIGHLILTGRRTRSRSRCEGECPIAAIRASITEHFQLALPTEIRSVFKWTTSFAGGRPIMPLGVWGFVPPLNVSRSVGVSGPESRAIGSGPSSRTDARRLALSRLDRRCRPFSF